MKVLIDEREATDEAKGKGEVDMDSTGHRRPTRASKPNPKYVGPQWRKASSGVSVEIADDILRKETVRRGGEE